MSSPLPRLRRSRRGAGITIDAVYDNAARYPDARYVHLVRDPDLVVASSYLVFLGVIGSADASTSPTGWR